MNDSCEALPERLLPRVRSTRGVASLACRAFACVICETLLRCGLCLLKEKRDGAVLRDLGNERLCVFLEKPCDSRKRLDEDLRHFLALQIARCQDKRCYACPHERQPLDVPIPDSMFFGKYNPAGEGVRQCR